MLQPISEARFAHPQSDDKPFGMPVEGDRPTELVCDTLLDQSTPKTGWALRRDDGGTTQLTPGERDLLILDQARDVKRAGGPGQCTVIYRVRSTSMKLEGVISEGTALLK